MSVWNQTVELSNNIESLFDANFNRYHLDNPIEFDGWSDLFWSSERIRKCHLKVIDTRETRKLWLMHINIFPDEKLNIPILGFDIVSGPNKITGSFFDYSPVGNIHPYSKYFESQTSKLTWNKPRELPDWAKEIFSDHMIAAGNIRVDEVTKLAEVTYDLIDYYVSNLDNSLHTRGDYKDAHNKYCANQKLNPHLHNSILSIGISEQNKNEYVDNILFAEL